MVIKYAEVAQLVEHMPEEHGVGGSNPPLGTRKNPARDFLFCAEGASKLLCLRADLKDGVISIAIGRRVGVESTYIRTWYIIPRHHRKKSHMGLF